MTRFHKKKHQTVRNLCCWGGGGHFQLSQIQAKAQLSAEVRSETPKVTPKVTETLQRDLIPPKKRPHGVLSVVLTEYTNSDENRHEVGLWFPCHRGQRSTQYSAHLSHHECEVCFEMLVSQEEQLCGQELFRREKIQHRHTRKHTHTHTHAPTHSRSYLNI